MDPNAPYNNLLAFDDEQDTKLAFVTWNLDHSHNIISNVNIRVTSSINFRMYFQSSPKTYDLGYSITFALKQQGHVNIIGFPGGDADATPETVTFPAYTVTPPITITDQSSSGSDPDPGSGSDPDPSTVTCEPGYYINDNQCAPCPEDTYSTSGNVKSCTHCPAGTSRFSSMGTKSSDCEQLYYLFCQDITSKECTISGQLDNHITKLQSCEQNSKCTLDDGYEIVILLYTYNSNLEIDVDKLNGQQVTVVKSKTSDGLVQLADPGHLKMTSTTVLTGRSDSGNKLEGNKGNVIIPSEGTSSLIVAFDTQLTIKQEQNIKNQLASVQLETKSENPTITLDSSVDISKQKMTFTSESKAKAVTVYTTSGDISEKQVLDFLSNPEDLKITVELKTPTPTSSTSSGLKPGYIALIVIGCALVIGAVIVVIIIVLRKKKAESAEV